MKIIKNYLYNASYQIFILIVPLLTVPYISRVLGSSGVGINAYTNSIIQYFILFGSIGINLYGNRTIAYCRDDKEKLSQSFWEISILRFICILFSYTLFVVFLLCISKYREYYFYQSFMLIAAAFDISWFFMGIEDFKKTVFRNTLIKIISLIAIFILVKTSKDLGKYILILSLSTLIGNLTFWTYLRKLIFFPVLRTINLKQHILPSLSLFVPQMATQIYLVLNKTMLGVIVGVTSAGYYENSDKIVKVILAIVTATGTVMLPRVANTFAKGNHEQVNNYLYSSFDFVSSISFPMAFGLAAIAPKFSVWFMGEDFAITGRLIPILASIIIFIAWSNVLGTQYLLPTNKTQYYTISVSIGAVSNILLNILLIPLLGVLGAVVATSASEMVVTIVQIYYVKRFVNLKNIFYQKWKYLIASIVMYLLISFIHQRMEGNVVNFGIQIILGIIVYVLIGITIKFPIIGRVKSVIKKEK